MDRLSIRAVKMVPLFISRRLHWGEVLLQQLAQAQKRPRLVVLPGAAASGSAGDLRGRAIGVALRRLGWRTLVMPTALCLEDCRRFIRAEAPDLLLLQKVRHRLNRPQLYDVPVVLDVDDADIQLQPELVAECCRNSKAVLAGNRYMADVLREFNPRVSVVWTGTYLRPRRGATPNHARAPVIAWAPSLLSMFPREAALVREIVLRLAARRRDFSFRLYGCDSAASAQLCVHPLLEAGVPVSCVPPLGYRRFARSLESVAIGLAPIAPDFEYGRGKSFGKVLAYIVSGCAVIASNAVDYPEFFRNGRNGLLAGSVDEWVEACEMLLDDAAARAEMARAAQADFPAKLSIEAAAGQVGRILRELIS